MIQRYSIYADGYYSIDESENGLCCLYADAEKWVGEEVAKWAGDRKEWMDKAMALARKNCDLQKEIAKKNEMIAGMRENKLYLENDLALKMEQIAALKEEGQEAACINNHNVEVASQEIVALKESFIKERVRRCQCEFDDGECFSPCKYHAKKDDQIAALKSLVDGASDIVEIWAAESPAQKEWKADWLAKARGALK